MTHQAMTFRASIISPITWSLLIPTLGSGVAALVCLPALFIWNDDVFISLILLVVCVWFILMWVYFLTLRVTLEEGRLVKSSWLRTKSVVLDEKTLIRHRADNIVLEGMDLTTMLAGMLSQESTTHMQITLRHGGRQVKIGSALKGISKLRDELVAFEKAVLVPAALRHVQGGDKVLLPPFEFQRSSVACKGRKAEVPLATAPELKGGELHFVMGGKRMRIALKKIWNPLTCLRILAQGTA
jgi:hypothetical protein